MTTEKLTLDICFKYPNARIKDGSMDYIKLINKLREKSIDIDSL